MSEMKMTEKNGKMAEKDYLLTVGVKSKINN